MLYFVKKLVPAWAFQLYHYALARLAAIVFRHPSESLIVIGVTGTSGKSTVVYLLAKMLERAGFRVGAASTIFFKIGKDEMINDRKMTMIGRFALQRLLRRIADAHCQYAIIETTSQGIEQFRHIGINFDIVLCTNLYPEHIEAHGSFENYKNAKLKLFEQLKSEPVKTIAGQRIPKTIIVNLDDDHAADFLLPWAEHKMGVTMTGSVNTDIDVVSAENGEVSAQGISFTINQQAFVLPLYGEHNITNALFVVAVGKSQGLSLAAMAEHLHTISNVPGRLEFIDEGQPFTVIVDYAFEPKAMAALYEVVSLLLKKRIIHVLGSTGGGRDTSRRPLLGELAGKNADIAIITNEDPYDEDPEAIIDQVADGAKNAGKQLNKDLFKITDRRSAIKKALKLAESGDIVLITGKGSEQAIAGPKETLIPWDDRQVVREEIKRQQGLLAKKG